jgi:hypothetical protein
LRVVIVDLDEAVIADAHPAELAALAVGLIGLPEDVDAGGEEDARDRLPRIGADRHAVDGHVEGLSTVHRAYAKIHHADLTSVN